MSRFNYILKDGVPIRTPDILTWGRWYESADEERRVARDEIDGVLVSTVFLGLDHSFDMGGPPVLWETMIFGLDEEYCERYTSREDAEAGHAQAVEMVRQRTGC
jgi:hypothetical protein